MQNIMSQSDQNFSPEFDRQCSFKLYCSQFNYGDPSNLRKIKKELRNLKQSLQEFKNVNQNYGILYRWIKQSIMNISKEYTIKIKNLEITNLKQKTQYECNLNQQQDQIKKLMSDLKLKDDRINSLEHQLRIKQQVNSLKQYPNFVNEFFKYSPNEEILMLNHQINQLLDVIQKNKLEISQLQKQICKTKNYNWQKITTQKIQKAVQEQKLKHCQLQQKFQSTKRSLEAAKIQNENLLKKINQFSKNNQENYKSEVLCKKDNKIQNYYPSYQSNIQPKQQKTKLQVVHEQFKIFEPPIKNKQNCIDKNRLSELKKKIIIGKLSQLRRKPLVQTAENSNKEINYKKIKSYLAGNS